MYKIINCKSPEEFWGKLAPEKPLKPQPCKFIFRGQKRANDKLIPSILRREKVEKNAANRIWGKKNIKSEEQVFSELRILQTFTEACDLLSLKIPNDSHEFRENYLNLDKADVYFRNPTRWPDDKLLELMALAQHHGVPTQLLDWTKRSYVAAYFAASKAIKEQNENGFFAVWALDIEHIKLYQNIKIVNVPGSTTSNLAAQAGIFTILQHDIKRGKSFSTHSIEQEFKKSKAPPLWKITLPVKHSKRILELCDLYGINGATLFPSYNGAARFVLDSINLWDRF